MKGARAWLDDLRTVCETHYDAVEEGKTAVRKLRSEWCAAASLGEVPEVLLTGLEMRAGRLLESDPEGWVELLDSERFWKPGWRPRRDDE